MSFIRRTLPALGLGAVLGVMMSVGGMMLADKDQKRAPLPLEDLKAFSEVFGQIKAGCSV